MEAMVETSQPQGLMLTVTYALQLVVQNTKAVVKTKAVGAYRHIRFTSDIDPEHKRRKEKENKDRKIATKGENIDEKELERLKTPDRQCMVVEERSMRPRSLSIRQS
ncbi:hypothetical protein NDU88_004515 [Pleurodeles waltl]|uniref:Uncharacterized protein n=1 Tax=Pleurodeles waltl TaxID=8319 RepID=A0AAV7NNN6_PLEWA|nr:hypothetical protein NDU88_004515 [Pleurodeles waltl]